LYKKTLFPALHLVLPETALDLLTSTSSSRRTASPAAPDTAETSIGIWPSLSGTIQNLVDAASLLYT